MLAVRLWSGLALVLMCGAIVRAESVPNETTIAVPEVEVRSGPSNDPKIYPTTKLRQGEKVVVVKEEDGGWLAIKPPQGSFSWVNARFLEMTSAMTAIINSDDVPVRIGSDMIQAMPTVEAKARLKRGAQVVLRDQKPATNEEGNWLPILPTPEEVRYIPAAALKLTPQVQTAQAAPALAPAPEGVAILQPKSVAASEFDPLWEQAQEAERAGNLAAAEELYLQLARKPSSDHDLQMRCYNRICFLRQGYRNCVPPAYTAARPAQACYPPSYYTCPRPVVAPYCPPAQPMVSAPRPNQAASYYTYQKEPPLALTRPESIRPTPAVSISARPVVNNPAPPVSSSPPIALNAVVQSSGPGWLRRAPFWLDQKPTYVLESSQGMPRLYVTAQPGVNLEPYVNRNVDLCGPVIYRGDLKTNYMTANQVKPLP